MSLDHERAVVEQAHLAWGESDLEGFLACLTEDVVYAVNVDGLQVPYAASTAGKQPLRERLTLLLNTFEIQAFVIQGLAHDADCIRTSVLGFYKHKKTGERLDVRLRFVTYVASSLITRIEEYHDAAYVEAFQRFVAYLEAAAEDDAQSARNSSDPSP
ncbi:MAG: hypothetical protein CTY20_07560 [Hyphomicrobium sp.]|nr:MAG: hypothetical protein CTY20_07560 [Hyphomicrobium sp.]